MSEKVGWHDEGLLTSRSSSFLTLAESCAMRWVRLDFLLVGLLPVPVLPAEVGVLVPPWELAAGVLGGLGCSEREISAR